MARWKSQSPQKIAVAHEGNVVLAYTNDHFLMLDCDLKREDEVKEFSREYAKFHDLGDPAAFKTSDTPQVDLFGNRLGNCCIIFGKPLSWDEIRWHIGECYRLGMVNKGFAALRKFGSITIRVNAKNSKIPPPRPIFYYSNGDKRDREGVMQFVRHWVMCRDMGKKELSS